MKDSLKIVLFAAVLGAFCAGVLTAASYLLRDFQEANEQAERLRNVFTVLDVPFDEDASAADLLRKVRDANNPAGVVEERRVDDLLLFTHRHGEEGLLVAVEFAGPGLWGPVKGIVSLKADLRTVHRIAFFEHEETPGLGGEISAEHFTDRFRSKVIAGEGAEPGLWLIAPGSKATLAPNEVDGISGATMTCQKVSAMLNLLGKRIQAKRQAILREVQP